MELSSLTEKIIGCAIAVQRELGAGFLESIYENAFLIELRESGLKVESQTLVPIHYRGQAVGEHRLDLLVEKSIVVELKALKDLKDIHFAQTRSYIKALGLKHGLLINFATIPLTVKRVIYESKTNEETRK